MVWEHSVLVFTSLVPVGTIELDNDSRIVGGLSVPAGFDQPMFTQTGGPATVW